MLMTDLHPEDLQPDHPHTWQFLPENTDTDHYPGYTFAQFLAYYNDRAGIYIACEDAEGRIKRFKPVHHGAGVRLGISHVGDWPRAGARTLEYDTVLGTFAGDWTDAATIYRDWSLQQPWASKPLRERTDVPDWLLDSPPHLMLRIQGEIDDGPTDAIEEFLPYTRALDPLDRLAQRLDTPLVPVLMGWERPGPWIYPDCFPPVGGEEAMREFAERVRSRGWHLGSFCNGTRWVTGHYWSGYDGREYFDDHDGAASVCRLPAGEPWQEFWDATWRPSNPCCVGAPATKETAIAFVKTLLDIGFDWIQFFDQNVGAAAFPCYAAGHDHPPMPGLWMTEHLGQLLESFRELAEHDPRQIVFSVEGPVNEFFLQEFQMADIRSSPPGHRPLNTSLDGLIPLYHFLYHELILMHGGFGSAPDPHHLEIRTAYNFVLGEIVGAVMHHDGSLMSKDTALWWARRDPNGGDDSAILGLLASATELRRGIGRDFLVSGRMAQSPAIDDIEEICWEEQGRAHRIPAVFHAAWETADLRYAVALANWTADDQEVSVTTLRLGSEATLHVVNGDQVEPAVLNTLDGTVRVVVPPRSCALLEASASTTGSLEQTRVRAIG